MSFTRRTLFPADKADDIRGPIKYDVTENTVHITWQEPAAPNGMIILYEVNYKRHGDTEVRRRIGRRFFPLAFTGRLQIRRVTAVHATDPEKCVRLLSDVRFFIICPDS